MSQTTRVIIVIIALIGLSLTMCHFAKAESPDPAVVLKALKNIRQLEEQESAALKGAKAENEALKRSLETNVAEAKALKDNERKAIATNAELIPQLAEARQKESDYRFKYYRLLGINIVVAGAFIAWILLKTGAGAALKALIPW